VVDVAKKEAYFPILVGLVFHPELSYARTIDGQTVIVSDEPDPESWSAKERREFWEELFKGIRGLKGSARNRQRSKDSSANAEVIDLLVSARISPAKRQPGNQIIQSVMSLLSRYGTLEGFSSKCIQGKRESSGGHSETMPETAAKRFDVFLAHNSKDKTFVGRVAYYLRRRGIVPWIDQDQIAPGHQFQQQLQHAICKVSAAAIFIGPHGVGPWQNFELQSFVAICVKKKIPVIPVLLPGQKAIPRRLPFLNNLNYVTFKNRAGEKTALDQLSWGITGQKAMH
jgi:hypothetical protein